VPFLLKLTDAPNRSQKYHPFYIGIQLRRLHFVHHDNHPPGTQTTAAVGCDPSRRMLLLLHHIVCVGRQPSTRSPTIDKYAHDNPMCRRGRGKEGLMQDASHTMENSPMTREKRALLRRRSFALASRRRSCSDWHTCRKIASNGSPSGLVNCF
jgi:hypothetical protein